MPGLSDKSQKTTTNSNQNVSSTSNGTSSVTPNVPDWFLNPIQQQAGNITGLMNQGPSSFTTSPSALQTQAFGAGSQLGTPGQYGDATDLVNATKGYVIDPGGVKGQSLLDGLQSYIDPGLENVVNTSLADYDVNSGKTRAAQAAQAADTGAFRGSRYGLREAATEGELARGRATTDAGLRSAAFTQALGASGQDADRRQAAKTGNADRYLAAQQDTIQNRLNSAGLLQGIGNDVGANNRANVGVLAGLGDTQHGIEDAQRTAPLTFANTINGLLAGLDPSTFIGKTIDTSDSSSGTQTGSSTSKTTDTPSMMDTAAKLAQVAALFMG